MKSYIPYSLLLAAAASGLAYGATAYTTPVGYVSINVPALSDTTITPPLERPTLLATASTSISGNIVGASSLTAGAYTTPECYLQVTSGPIAGQRFPITANNTTTITVSSTTTLQSLGFASGNTFKVVPFWTLNTLFPSGAGVGTTSDAFNPTSFVFASSTGSGTNKSSANAYFYCTGDVDNGVPAGWYDANNPSGAPLNDLRLDLSRMYSVRSSSATAQTVTVSGQVPSAAPKIQVAVTTGYNDVYLGAPFPVDTTLQASGLQSAIQASPDAFNPIEVIFVYNDNGTGYNKAAAVGYFYCSGDIDNGVPAGWYDSNNPAPGAEITGAVIKAGRCMVIRKAPYGSAGAVLWNAPLPYSL